MTTRPRTTGFTLVELIVIVAILVTMLAVAMPIFSQTIAQRRLTSAVERVVNDLRYVQSLAVTEGVVHRLHSGTDGAVGRPGEYRLERDNGAGGWTQISAWYDPSTDYRGSRLQGIKDNAGTTLASHDLRFNSRGAVANTGVGNFPIVLTVVAENGATRAVQVLRTGVVRIP